MNINRHAEQSSESHDNADAEMFHRRAPFRVAGMALERSQIYELRDGRADVVVGPLSPVGVRFLEAKVSDVYLSKDSLAHIERDHPDVTEFDLLCASAAIWQGLLIGFGKCVIASYENPDTRRRYKAVVKCARGGFDLWLTTFHRTAPRQTARLVNRGVILQRHA